MAEQPKATGVRSVSPTIGSDEQISGRDEQVPGRGSERLRGISLKVIWEKAI